MIRSGKQLSQLATFVVEQGSFEREVDFLYWWCCHFDNIYNTCMYASFVVYIRTYIYIIHNFNYVHFVCKCLKASKRFFLLKFHCKV